MSNTRRCLSLAVFAGVASQACVDQTLLPSSTNAIIVHAVLDANVRDQYIVVQQTFGAPSTQVRSKSASVTVTTPSGIVMVADEVEDSARVIANSFEPAVGFVYRISLDKYGVTLAAGGTYTLRVVVLGWPGDIRGTTVMPGAPPSLPAPVMTSFARAKDTLALEWRKVPFAHSYEVSVSAANASYGVFADTSLMLPGVARTSLGNQVFWPGVSNTVTVSAVDRNYYDYYRKSTDDLTPSSPVNHLVGAIGVFGSISRISSQVLQVK